MFLHSLVFWLSNRLTEVLVWPLTVEIGGGSPLGVIVAEGIGNLDDVLNSQPVEMLSTTEPDSKGLDFALVDLKALSGKPIHFFHHQVRRDFRILDLQQPDLVLPLTEDTVDMDVKFCKAHYMFR